MEGPMTFSLQPAHTVAPVVRRRLTGLEIRALRFLGRRREATVPASLPPWIRRHVVELWRRGIILVWYRQVPDQTPSLQGPYCSLSDGGVALARAFDNRGRR